MRAVFQQELQEVQERLVEIASLVEASIENATRAFNESNVALADTVIADDDKIDELTISLDELAINILARQQPVARDLRIVVSALRISASLERMGDMSEHIAQLARYRFPGRVGRKTPWIPRSPRATTNASPTTPSPSPRRCNTWRRATGRSLTPRTNCL